jgi:translation initiation factor 2B subunit (eIF-2B alpha/beta/delta family)
MEIENVHSLEDGIRLLKNDRTNGARVLATNALKILQVVIENLETGNTTIDDLWQRCRVVAYSLTLARPSMSAAITSAVVKALSSIQVVWERHEEQTITSFKESAKDILIQQIQERERSNEQVARAFLEYLQSHAVTNRGHARILTLSSSSTLATCLSRAVKALPDISFTISVLESRPNMEGASFAVDFLDNIQSSGDGDNITIEVATDSHVCKFARNIDFLLLGADRISGQGDVSNKMGSLAATIAVKSLSDADVVVIAESDKIARPSELEELGDEENDLEEVSSVWPAEIRSKLHSLSKQKLQLRNIYFEWIPTKYIDVYVTEEGSMDTHAIENKSKEKGRLENTLFDNVIVEHLV